MVDTFNPEVEVYRPYRGAIVKNIPRVKEDGRTLLSTKGAMEARLHVLGSPEEMYSWHQNPITTADGLLMNYKDQKVKVVHNATEAIQGLEHMTIGSRGGFVLPLSMYPRVPGEEFNLNQINRYCGERSINRAPKNRMIRSLAHDDRDLVSDYCEMLQGEYGVTHFGLQIYDLENATFDNSVEFYFCTLDWDIASQRNINWNQMVRNLNGVFSVTNPQALVIGVDEALHRKYKELFMH